MYEMFLDLEVGLQKCQFLAKIENWTNVYAFCSRKLIIINEYLIYMEDSSYFGDVKVW